VYGQARYCTTYLSTFPVYAVKTTSQQTLHIIMFTWYMVPVFVRQTV